MKPFGFSNINKIEENIVWRANYHHIKITSLNIDEASVNIEAKKWIASENDVIEFFRHAVGAVVCAQNICKPMYVTNHIWREATLDVEGDEIEIKIIVNKEFDVNDYYK